MIIRLIEGDWSADGHGKTLTISIETNLTKKQIETAYKRGVKKCGVDLIEFVARSYQESSIDPVLLRKLIDSGYNPGEYDLWDMYSQGASISEEYVEMYLHIVKLGDPSFECEIVPRDCASEIHIGGYGLFE